MPATLPIELYDMLERQVGKEDARAAGKLILTTFDTIEDRAETVAIQKKAEIKEELLNELASKEDLAKLEGRLNEKINAVKGDLVKLEGRLNEKINAVEVRLNEKIAVIKEDMAKLEGRLNEKIAAVNERVTALDGKMTEKFTDTNARIKIYFLILLFTILLTNPKALDLIAKLVGLAK
ncbi:MAG: hypothetical protein HQK97_02265 [Nitrospirae bacterium]|nr:hypothetical protein [Nitrospirota bacterium]